MKKSTFIIMVLISASSLSQTVQTDGLAGTERGHKRMSDSLRYEKEQEDNTPEDFRISAYVEPYYSYDFRKPENHHRVAFNYSHNRHNEIAVNLALLKANYATTKVRANVTVAAGTYMNANYAAEPDVLKNLYEANAGVKISTTKNLWVDAGILPSHIGFESAVGKDNWTVTRGLYAENSPYFETGARLTYISDNERWTLSALVLNGWQRIQRVDGNNTPAFGHQLIYKPNSKVTLNSSSFIGNDKPDIERQMRYFHNLYGIFQLSAKWALTAGFDIGAEQKSKGSSQYNIWFAPVIIARFSPSDKIDLALRGEYFEDTGGVIIATNVSGGFKTYGYSFNMDYAVLKNVLFRVEARGFASEKLLFISDTGPRSQNFFVTTALAFSF